MNGSSWETEVIRSERRGRLRPGCRLCRRSVWTPNPLCPHHDVQRWFAYEQRLRVADAFAENLRLSRVFTRDYQRICGEVFFGEASPEEDRQHATDLISLWMPSRRLRIACRVRRWKYLDYYLADWTARTVGSPSELRKLAQGWGDYLLYCLLTPDDLAIDRWWIGDLQVWRGWFHEEIGHRRHERWKVDVQSQIEQIHMRRGDYVSPEDPIPGELSWDGRFRIFPIAELPPNFITKTSASS
jgi:hypothetical protein